MSFDPNIPAIALSYRAPEIKDPLQAAAQVLQMKGLMQQQQLGGLQIQEQQLALDRTKSLNDAYKSALVQGPDGSIDIDPGKLTQALGTAGQGSAIPTVLEAITKMQQSRATLHETIGKVAAAQQDFAGTIGSAVKAGNNDPRLFLALATHAAATKSVDPQLVKSFVDPVQQALEQDPTGESARQITGQIADHLIASSPAQQKIITEGKTADARMITARTGQDHLNLEKPGLELANVARGIDAVKDQAGYDALLQGVSPATRALLPTTYGPDTAAQVKRQTVVPKDQPEFDIHTASANALRSMTRADWDKALTATVPDPSTPLYRRTAAAVELALSRGDLKGAQTAIKDAGDQLGHTETAVATARATAPIKIDVAASTAAARADQAGLTDDDYQRAGEQYMRTGVMPAMGRDSITRGKIVHAGNEWARDNALKPQDIVTMQAAYAGDKDSLKKFQAQRDQIVSFEQTAQKNLDLFIAAASKIPDSGSPWLNKPLRSLDQSLVGSENMAAVNAARQIANNEIAKVTSGGGLGGVLSDSARHEVDKYNPENATFKQTLAVARILKADMANRHQAMDATLSDIKGRIGGGGGSAPAAGGPPRLPAILTGEDLGKVYVKQSGQKVKITDVNPKDGKLYKFVEVQ